MSEVPLHRSVDIESSRHCDYRGTSLIRNCNPLEHYSRLMPRALGVSWGGRRFLMSEVPL